MSSEKSGDVLALVSEVFAPVEVRPESTFDDLGADSLQLLRLMNDFHTEFDVQVDVIDMFTVENIAELVTLIESRRASSGV
jgi:acyl carrier protein